MRNSLPEVEQRDVRLNIALIGPYPPPYGGIAMTVFDLQRSLNPHHNICVLNIGEGREKGSGDYIAIGGPFDFVTKLLHYARMGYTIHLETNGHNFKSWMSALLCATVGLLNDRRSIIAFGSGNMPAYLKQGGLLLRLIAKVVVALAGVIVCRNASMVNAIRSLGIGSVAVATIPGFMGLRGRKPALLPPPIQHFIAAHHPVIGIVGTIEPEYGVDLTLRVFQQVCKEYQRAGLVIIGVGDETKNNLTHLAGVQDRVFLTGPMESDVALAAMQQLNVFVRPTYFDGDSLSVREALALKIPVVASDTGLRPAEVVTFRVGDEADLLAKLQFALAHREELVKRLGAKGAASDGLAPMIEIYRRMAKEWVPA